MSVAPFERIVASAADDLDRRLNGSGLPIVRFDEFVMALVTPGIWSERFEIREVEATTFGIGCQVHAHVALGARPVVATSDGVGAFASLILPVRTGVVDNVLRTKPDGHALLRARTRMRRVRKMPVVERVVTHVERHPHPLDRRFGCVIEVCEAEEELDEATLRHVLLEMVASPAIGEPVEAISSPQSFFSIVERPAVVVESGKLWHVRTRVVKAGWYR